MNNVKATILMSNLTIAAGIIYKKLKIKKRKYPKYYGPVYKRKGY